MKIIVTNIKVWPEGRMYAIAHFAALLFGNLLRRNELTPRLGVTLDVDERALAGLKTQK